MIITGGQNTSVGSVLGSLSCTQVPSSSESLAEGIFPLEITRVLTKKKNPTLSDESINRGLACVHMYSIARTKKILSFMSWMTECRQQKHTQHVPSTKTECDYLYGWIEKKKTITHEKISTKMVNPRDLAGNAKEEEESLRILTMPFTFLFLQVRD